MNAIKRCKPLLGTFVEVSVSDAVSDKALMALTEQAFKAISDVEAMMSFHNVESELSRINRHAYLSPIAISPEMYQVLTLARKLSHITEGVYDITVTPKLIEQGLLPDHGWQYNAEADWTAIDLDQESISFRQRVLLDLGGIAKGFAVDKALAVLKETDAIVNAGGDLKMTQWQNKTASIRQPHNPAQAFQTIEMQAAALATSGSYFLDNDKVAILDPRHPPEDKPSSSVSIFADSCMVADALTKVATLLHPKETTVLAELNAQAIYH